jgi:hypothetical protein
MRNFNHRVPFILYDGETWCLPLTEEHKLRVKFADEFMWTSEQGHDTKVERIE